MKTLYGFFLAFLITQSYQTLFAQNESAKLSTYDKDGLKFEYPSDWILTDKSSPDVQLIHLSKPKSTVLIIISSQKELLQTAAQFSVLQSDSHSKYGEAISESLSSKEEKAKWETHCLDFNGRRVIGTKYTGILNNKAGSGEVYPFALGNRFLALVYLKAEDEQSSLDIVWQNFIKSLYLGGSNKEVEGVAFHTSAFKKSVINGSAIKLVKPDYPSIAGKTGKRDTVNVKVLIDEEGNIISAKAISGDKVFHREAEWAAKRSKFRPTILCDKPVKVDGIIVYTFVP